MRESNSSNKFDLFQMIPYISKKFFAVSTVVVAVFYKNFRECIKIRNNLLPVNSYIKGAETYLDGLIIA